MLRLVQIMCLLFFKSNILSAQEELPSPQTFLTAGVHSNIFVKFSGENVDALNKIISQRKVSSPFFQYSIEVDNNTYSKIGFFGAVEASLSKTAPNFFHNVAQMGSYFKIYYPFARSFHVFSQAELGLAGFNYGYSGLGLSSTLLAGIQAFFHPYWGLLLSVGYQALFGKIFTISEKNVIDELNLKEPKTSSLITAAPTFSLSMVSLYW